MRKSVYSVIISKSILKMVLKWLEGNIRLYSTLCNFLLQMVISKFNSVPVLSFYARNLSKDELSFIDLQAALNSGL